jgi:hypothetical protein
MLRNVVLGMLCVCLALAIGVAQADVIKPVAAQSSSNYSYDPTYADWTIDGLGYVSTGFVSTGDVSTWYQTGHVGGEGMSLSEGGVLPVLTYDLGGTSTLSGAYVWNSAQWGTWTDGLFYDSTDRGFKHYDILTSMDGTTFTSVSGGVGYELAKTPVSTNAATQYQAFTPTVAKYVEITASSTWGASYASISEVRFEGTAVTAPEPSTIVLLTTGLVGLIAYAWRKKS